MDDRTTRGGGAAHATLPRGAPRTLGKRQDAADSVDALRLLSSPGQKRLRLYTYLEPFCFVDSAWDPIIKMCTSELPQDDGKESLLFQQFTLRTSSE